MDKQEVKSKTNKKMGVKYCPFLDKQDEKTCNILKELCFIIRNTRNRRCSFSEHYEYLTSPSSDNPIAKKIKEMVLSESRTNWQKHVQKGTPSGQKHMTGTPMEVITRESIKEELQSLIVNVTKPKKEFSVVPDCRIDKCINDRRYPTTIISIKTWLSPEAIRETFAYAYLFKHKYGADKYQVFVVGLNPINEDWVEMIEAFKGNLDGVYSLSGKPYIDDLIEKLRSTYAYKPTKVLISGGNSLNPSLRKREIN